MHFIKLPDVTYKTKNQRRFQAQTPFYISQGKYWANEQTTSKNLEEKRGREGERQREAKMSKSQ